MKWKHPWIPMTDAIQKDMLKTIGKKEFEDLFCNIPEKFILKKELDLPDSHSEIEVMRRIQELASTNKPADNGRVFMGAGVGLHYVPSAVTELATRSEFVTSYTSYQAEISQGMLQTLFEYQSLLAELLDIDLVNSSMYDMATALAEAVRMAVRVKKRNRFLVPGTLNPEHMNVTQTYTEPADIVVEQVDYDKKTGLLSLSDLDNRISDDVAGVYIENPSYLGFIESQVDEIEKIVHENGALFVVGVDILSLGLLRAPGNYGADIVISEGQPLGVPMTYGGPLLGIFGCRDERKLIYQMPGRLVGLTRTEEEPYEPGYVLTISAREQHIRREKATSNICSNQALMAVTAAIYVSLLGKSGFSELGETIAYKSNYMAKKLNEIPGVIAPSIGGTIWKEFVVSFEDMKVSEVHDALLKHSLHGGKMIKKEFPDLGESMLVSVTELHEKEVIDEFVEIVRMAVSKGGKK